MTNRKYSLAVLLLSLLGATLLLSIGCGKDLDRPAAPEEASAPIATESPTFGPTLAVAEAPTPTPAEPEIMAHNPERYYGAASLDESILRADTVARVQLLSATPTVKSIVGRHGDLWPYAVLEFRFRVLEYLRDGKGGSPDEITAVLLGYRYTTEAEARAVLPELVAERETRWDGREAIVFLNDNWGLDSEILPSGRYYFGNFAYWGEDAYTVASPHHKEWLPAASSEGATGATDEQRFLLDAPGGAARGASGQTGSTPIVTLTALKARVAALEVEATVPGASGASGDAAPNPRKYRTCVQRKYTEERKILWKIANEGTATFVTEDSLSSGQPAGTVVWEDRFGIGYPPDNMGRHWLEGEDKDLFIFETLDPEPTILFSGINPGTPPDAIFFTRRMSTARPLPSGEYQFFRNGMSADRLLCNAYSELERKTIDSRVTVTAPTTDILAESFFDPTADGEAVGGSTTIGPIKWEAGQVEATLTLDVTGRKLDFIALDGAVTLSLDAADATKTGSVLSWPVAEKPWNAGDKLMLRVDTPLIITPEPTATPTPEPTSTPTLVPTPSIGISEITDTSALIVISNAPESAAFTWAQAPCAEVPAGEEEVQLLGLSPDEEYTATLYSDSSCENQLDSVTFRTQVSSAPDATDTPEEATP